MHVYFKERSVFFFLNLVFYHKLLLLTISIHNEWSSAYLCSKGGHEFYEENPAWCWSFKCFGGGGWFSWASNHCLYPTLACCSSHRIDRSARSDKVGLLKAWLVSMNGVPCRTGGFHDRYVKLSFLTVLSISLSCFYRFLFLLLGPFGKGAQYHEIGRSIATLMTDEVRYLPYNVHKDS